MRRWGGGSVANNGTTTATNSTDEFQDKLSAHELTFQQKYDTLMSEYSSEIGLNLRSFLSPPTALSTMSPVYNIAQNSHAVLTDEGAEFNLQKGQALIAPSTMAEEYVQQGLLRSAM